MEADGNYTAPGPNDLPYSPAKLKKLVANGPNNGAFVLNRTHPQGQASKLRIFKDQAGTQEVQFQNDVSENFSIPAIATSTQFWVKGLQATVDNAPSSASEHYEDQAVELRPGTRDNLGDPASTAKWTALWIKLDLVSAVNVIPNDNSAVAYYGTSFGVAHLGPLGSDQAFVPNSNPVESLGCYYGILFGVDMTGTVYPSDLPSQHFTERRFELGSRAYAAGAVVAGVGQHDNGPPLYSVDDDPTSGGSAGVIYSLDAPGIGGSFSAANSSLPTYRQNTVVAAHGKFTEWTELSSERCSERYPWYYRRAAKKLADGPAGMWQDVAFGANDNQAGRGSTNLTLDLTPSTMQVNMTVAPGEYQANQMNATFTATVAGGTSPFTFNWAFLGAPPPQSATAQNPLSDAETKLLTADRVNHGTHVATVTVTDTANHSDTVSQTVHTNLPPVVHLTGSMAGGNLTLSAAGTSDPEGQKITDVWLVGFFDGKGGGVTQQIRNQLPNAVNEPVPAGTTQIRVVLTCTDTFGASSYAVLSLP